jgi:hypothetical protein
VVLGSLPLLPWLVYMARALPHSHAPGSLGAKLVEMRYGQYWVADALGPHAWYNLGRPAFMEYLSYPLLGGRPTYLVALAHALLFLAGAALLLRGLFLLLWQRRREPCYWGRALTGGGSETGFVTNGALLAGGLVMTLLAPTIYRHYLLVTFPLEWVWLACLALATSPADAVTATGIAVAVPSRWLGKRMGRRLLLAIWAAQLVLAASLLHYLHVNHGAPNGDFGVTHARQRQLGVEPKASPGKAPPLPPAQ